MPFASMTDEDVQAFYALLDEYFESRKDLFASWVNGQAAPSAAAPAVTAHSPPAPPAGGRMVAPPPPVSRTHAPAIPAAPSPPASPAGGTARPKEPNNKYGVTVPSMNDFKDPKFQDAFRAAGKGISATGGFVNRHVLGNKDAAAATPPSGNAPPPKASKPSTFQNLKQVSAGMTAMNSLRDRYGPSTPNATPAPPPPVANHAPIAPPPVRATAPPPVSSYSAPPPSHGMGVCTAQYDYASEESGDLPFREGDKITLLSKESDDWWKGELRGRQGLFPASYVVEG